MIKISFYSNSEYIIRIVSRFKMYLVFIVVTKLSPFCVSHKFVSLNLVAMIHFDRLYIGPADDPKSVSGNNSSCHAPISNHRASALPHIDRVFVAFADFSSSLAKRRVEKETELEGRLFVECFPFLWRNRFSFFYGY